MHLSAPLKHRRAGRLAAPAPIPIQAAPPRPIAQAKQGCSCGGGCLACRSRDPAGPDHPAEREADAVAARVMSMSPGTQPVQRMTGALPMRMPELEEEEESLQRQPEDEEEEVLQPQMEDDEEEELLQPSAETGGAVRPAGNPMAGLGGGQPLPTQARRFFEPRFGRSFANVRIHDGGAAADRARDVNAQAFTYGRNIVFSQGRYNPDSDTGRRLLAHELTHVVQQGRADGGILQRYCDDPDFCTPYATQAEIDSARWWIENTYMRAEGLETFGTEVKSLYEAYMDRRPGDSLAPRVFDNEDSYLLSSFRESGDTTDDMDAVIDLVGDRLSRAPGWPLRNNRRTIMSLRNFLSDTEMDNRPINYSNPLSVAGHIAGGIGSSDAGDDYRKITRANVALEKVPVLGGTGYVKVELIPFYEVFDAIDFCPGDCGSPAEQLITIPMSRLEASGEVYDMPFKVVFRPETRFKRFWY